MQILRMDLDPACTPAALVAAILRLEPTLAPPIPIEELALQLDTVEIRNLETEGFEGGLITDRARSDGFILVNRAANRGRRRFTIAHELAHFLLPHHEPPSGSGFLCSRADLGRTTAAAQDKVGRMEVEANQFAAGLLLPPPMVRSYLARFREADLAHISDVAGHFDVSKEMAVRTYAQFHREPAAALVVKHGRVLRSYRGPSFPALAIKPNDLVPVGAVFRRVGHKSGVASDLCEVRSELWIETSYGRRLPGLFEQVLLQRDGYALILLVADPADEPNDEEDADAERTAKERLAHRFGRSSDTLR